MSRSSVTSPNDSNVGVINVKSEKKIVIISRSHPDKHTRAVKLMRTLSIPPAFTLNIVEN